MLELILANVLLGAGEIVVPMPVEPAPGTRIVIADAWGQVVRETARPASGPLRLSWDRPGWFELRQVAPGAPPKAVFRFAALTPLPPDLPAETPFGAMTHFAAAWDPDLIPWLAAAGIRHVRDEIFWDSIEAEKDRFAFPAKFETYMASLARHEILPLTPLTFGNRHYDATPGVPLWAAAPYTEDGFRGYARYSREVLAHYGRQLRYVEVWNEYNGGFAQGPAAGRPEVYANMLRECYRAVKAERPDVQVLAGGTIGIPLNWIEAVLANGGAECLDGFSVHPYGYSSPPETLVPKLEGLRTLLRRYCPGREVPIWVTEQGWYTTEPGKLGNRNPITESAQARYLVRAWTLFLAQGVAKSFWYLGRDDQAFGSMGLLGKPDSPLGRYAPKPAYVAYAVLIRQLAGLQCVRRLESPPSVHAYAFANGARNCLVLWATEPAGVTVAANGPATVTDLFGGTRRLVPRDGALHLYLNDAPLYLDSPAGELRPDPGFAVSVPPVVPAGRSARLEFRLPEGVAWTGCVGERQGPVAGAGDWPVAGDAVEAWQPFALGPDAASIQYFGIAHSQVAPPVALDRFPRLLDHQTLAVPLRNLGPAPLQAVRARWQVGEQHGELPLAVAVPAAGEVRLAIPLPAGLPPGVILPAKVEVELADGTRLSSEHGVSYNPVLPRTVAIDGELADWEGLPVIDITGSPYEVLIKPDNRRGAVGGIFRFCYDAKYLYVAARLRDEVFCQEHSGYNVWRGDNIQLGLSADLPWAGGEWFGDRQELGLTLAPKGPEVFRFNGHRPSGFIPAARLAVQREEGWTIYEASLPWDELGRECLTQRHFSLGLFVNDNDGTGRRGYLRWGSCKDSCEFQPFVLVGPYPAAEP